MRPFGENLRWVPALALALALIVGSTFSCDGKTVGGRIGDDDDSTGGGDDDTASDDDDSDDDGQPDDDQDQCDPSLTTPTLDYHAICHKAGSAADQCEGQSVAAKTFDSINEAADWGVLLRYDDKGCDLTWIVTNNGEKSRLPEGTECGTGAGDGLFITWDYARKCQGHAGGTIVIDNSVQLFDACNFATEKWGFTISVICD